MRVFVWKSSPDPDFFDFVEKDKLRQYQRKESAFVAMAAAAWLGERSRLSGRTTGACAENVEELPLFIRTDLLNRVNPQKPFGRRPC